MPAHLRQARRCHGSHALRFVNHHGLAFSNRFEGAFMQAIRRFPFAIVALLCIGLAVACSRSTTPPTGRWEGTLDARDAIVAARLEITPKGQIYVSAPNAEDFGNVSDEDRAAMRQRLADGLAESWDSVRPMMLDFDGTTFRKPGGIAPQMEWDGSQMTLVVYLGKRDALRIPLRPVKQFSPDPWSNA
jgi:hypothetical protein